MNQISIPNTFSHWHLTFKWPDWYFNFTAWFMKNILFEQKMNNDKQDFVGFKFCCMSWKCGKFSCCLHIYKEFFKCSFMCVNICKCRSINPLAFYFLYGAPINTNFFCGKNDNFVHLYFIHAKLIFMDFKAYPCCAVMLGWSLNCIFKNFLWCDTP
jgi:hypothetical protein